MQELQIEEESIVESKVITQPVYNATVVQTCSLGMRYVLSSIGLSHHLGLVFLMH